MKFAVRSLPLRVPLQPGEALDSWLIRLAHRNRMPLRRLALALGLVEQGRDIRLLSQLSSLPSERLRRVEAQTGLETGSLDSAVIGKFADIGWSPIIGSRFCPACLRETGGAWQIRWQMAYAVACVRHQCLLATICPSCGEIPHRITSLHTGTLPSTTCTVHPRRAGGICGADLLNAATSPFGSSDTRIRTQSWIDQRLDDQNASILDLQDVDFLARSFRRRMQPVDVAHLGDETANAVRELRHHRQRRLRLAPGTELLIDAAVTHLAVELLDAAESTRFQRFAPLFRHRANTAASHPRSAGPMVFSRNRIAGLSTPRQQAILKACDRHLPPAERLRYHTMTPQPRLAAPDSTRAANRARWIPQRLWQDWLVRFCPVQGVSATSIAVDLPLAMLLPGSPLRNTEAVAELGIWKPTTSTMIGLLSTGAPDVLTAICYLADYLDVHGGRIDYRCRRRMFGEVELPEAIWKRLCDAAQVDPGTSSKRLLARLYVFTLLTGTDVLTCINPPGNPDENTKRVFEHTFRWSMPQSLRCQLHRYAEMLLNKADIDEPVTWSPPVAAVAGLQLPGPEPDSRDPRDLARLSTRRPSADQIARELDTTVEHVRYLIEQLDPDPAFKSAADTPVLLKQPQQPTIDQSPELSAASLEKLLIHEGKTLFEIADMTDLAYKIVCEHAMRWGSGPPFNFSLPPAGEVSLAWLLHQKILLERPDASIATDLGVKYAVVRNLRIKLGIEPASLGSQCFPNLPTDIRNAVEGQPHGWTRLLRFQQAMRFSSLVDAGNELDYHPSNLHSQFNRLERDIDAKLFERWERSSPMRPTARGAKLLEDLDREDVNELLQQHARKARIHRPSRSAQDTPAEEMDKSLGKFPDMLLGSSRQSPAQPGNDRQP